MRAFDALAELSWEEAMALMIAEGIIINTATMSPKASRAPIAVFRLSMPARLPKSGNTFIGGQAPCVTVMRRWS